jgi:drug/metabolite transporter (DMT)-like permease
MYMLAAMGGFVVNDACTKYATRDLEVAQIMAVRGVMATTFLGLLAWRSGAFASVGRTLTPRLGARTLADIGATISYLTALAHMPMANASAIFQATPLAVTLGAALFLGEKVGWRRWTAIGTGFLGVLVIVQPGTEGFSVHSLAVLVAVACSSTRDLVTRRMDATVPSITISLVTAVAVCLVGWAWLPFVGWQVIAPDIFLALAVGAVSIGIGYIFIVKAMRIGDLGFVAPFRYSILLYALVLGFLLFGDRPTAPVLVGAAIVVASGLYTLLRERKVGRVKVARAQVH